MQKHQYLAEVIMKSTRLFAALAVVVVGAACGEAIDINRVAPGAVNKNVFKDEWYTRGVVVDKQFGTDRAFIGAEGGMERIKWEITENYLVGFRSYEKVPGTDPSNPGEQTTLVMFPIVKHFDIRRQYNAVNGVESNVIEENDYDRPWWERDYIRVAWNTQHADSYDIGEQTFFGRGQNGVDRNGTNDAAYPWKVRIGDTLLGANPVEEGDYIETTIDGTLAADPYICYFLDQLSSCNGAQIKLKYSFMKVPQGNDYVALDYPDYVKLDTGTMVLVDGDSDPSNDVVVGVATAPLMIANDTQPSARMCTSSEMDRDGTRVMKVIDDPDVGVRMCNTGPAGDSPSSCRDALVRCDVERGSEYVAITPNNNPACDPNHHSPDDCVEITQSVFGRFGYFRTDRFQVDRENGSQYNARERLINRHNIWAKSTDDAGHPLPMNQRPVKPIVYVLNVGFPTDMVDLAQGELAADWELTFREAVAAARGLDGAHQLPQNLNDGFAGFPVVEKMFEVRVNACNIAAVNDYVNEHDMKDALMANNISAVAYGNLEEACAVLEHESQRRVAAGEDLPVFTWEQLGDLRYNFLNWASKAELAGPLGYGPSAADPITGEIISANANIYGASIDTYANWGADIVQLLNGELTTGDIINGTATREHVESVRNRWAKPVTKQRVDAFMNLFADRTRGMTDSRYFKQLPLTAMNAGLDKLRTSGIEDEYLLTSEALRLFGNDPVAAARGDISVDMVANARPSNWGRQYIPTQMLAAANAGSVASVGDQPFAAGVSSSSPSSAGMGKLDELADYLGRQNYCYLAQQVEPAIADLADQIKDEGLDREAIVNLIRRGVFRGVTAHELGHTFGLRHNFEGSADAMNYFPQYWGVGAEGLPEGKAHLLGAHPGTTDTYAVQYSSIMDYHQRFNSDFQGLGLYDKAAIKVGYAETVEVFDEDDGAFVARDWLTQTFLLDPADFPSLVAGDKADTVIDRLYDDAYEAALRGDQTSTLDIAGSTNPALAAKPENLYKRKNMPLRDWYRQELLTSRFTGGLDESECGDFGIDPQPGCMDFVLGVNGLADDNGRMPAMTVPYNYCSDEFAFGGNLTCNRYDMGPTSREIVKNAGEMYEFYYPFDAFRRDRALSPFSSFVDNYINRIYQRTYQPMLNAYRFFYYYRRSDTLRIFPTIRDWGTAALQGMDFFVRVLQQPEPGTYCKVGGTYVPQAEATEADCAADSAEIGLDQGRIYNSNWDSSYELQPINVGNYWDKALALQAMTSSDAFFFRDFSQETNRGAFSIGYYRVFQNEMLDLFGAVMRNDTSVFSPRLYDEDGDGELDVVYQSFLKTGIYGEPLPDTGTTPGAPVQPATSYQLRHWATIFGMVNMTSTLDQTLDFATRVRVTLAGQPGEPTLITDTDGDGVDDVEVVEFRDPLSSMVYRSVAVDGTEHSIGYRLLDEAKDLVDGEYADAVAALDTATTGGNADDIRAARLSLDRVKAKLNEKTQIIDFLVYLGDAFEFPG